MINIENLTKRFDERIAVPGIELKIRAFLEQAFYDRMEQERLLQ